MLEKGKISVIQMFMMIYLLIIPTAILTGPASIASLDKHELWMSPVWSSSFGLLAIYIVYKLNQLYPQKTLIECCDLVLGRVMGKIVSFMFLSCTLFLAASTVRQYGVFLYEALYHETPLIVTMGSIVMVSAYAVRGGLGTIGNYAQIIFPITILFILLGVIFLIPEMHPAALLPIMANGIKPSIKGAITIQIWFSEFIYLSFFTPYLNSLKHKSKWIFRSLLIVALTLIALSITSIMVLENTTNDNKYAFLTLIRYISLMNFFQHVESIFIMIWVLGLFAKICISYYILVLGTAQWFELSNYRPIVLPLGFVIILVSLWSATDMHTELPLLNPSDPFYFFSMLICIPLFILIVGWIRSKVSSSRSNQ